MTAARGRVGQPIGRSVIPVELLYPEPTPGTAGLKVAWHLWGRSSPPHLVAQRATAAAISASETNKSSKAGTDEPGKSIAAIAR